MQHSFEVILFSLFDVGRTVDMDKVRAITTAKHDAGPVTGRDTPDSIDLPHPVVVQLDQQAAGDDTPGVLGGDEWLGIDSLSLGARIFEEGVITMMLRLRVNCELTALHQVRNRRITLGGWTGTADQLMVHRFHELYGNIKAAVTGGQYVFDNFESESYRVYCLTEPVGDPAAYVEANRDYLASFLLGEDPSIQLHETQVRITLGHPFSFRGDDLAIFDMDRCFIIDARRDYEDLLLIAEHANYQLLELRTLDKLLDRRLDIAEKDAARQYRKRKFSIKRSGIKLSALQPLRLDALFILNSLENSSKIIGDFYLCQIYDHLCGLFNTHGWKSNIERSLETLQDIYAMAKGDSHEKALLLLEFVVVALIAVELVIFLAEMGK